MPDNIAFSSFWDIVSPTIADRGTDYYQRGLVTSLEETAKNHWLARVQGTVMYTVEITFSNDAVKSWSCDCPYDYGPVCKHVAAVMIALEYQDSGKQESSSTQSRQPRQSLEMTFHTLLGETSPDKIIDFLRDYARFHPEIMQEFVARYATPSSQDAWREYVLLIREAARAGADRHGFIDYSSSFRVMQPIHTLVEHAYEMLESKDYQGAWYIARAIIQEVPKLIQRMDDSSGDAGLVTDNALDIIQEIGTATEDANLHDIIFKYLVKNYSRERYTDFGFDETILTVVIDIIRTSNQAEQVKRLLEKRLVEVKKDKEDFSYRYNLQRSLEQQIHFLQQTGKDSEANQIIDENLHIDAFRELRIQQAIDQKEFDRAKSLVQDGIEQSERAKNQYSFTHDWTLWLFRIAQAERDTENIRKYGMQIFLHNGCDFTYYGIFKSTYSTDEWKQELDKLLEHFRGMKYSPGYVLAEIFVREDMWEDLLEHLKQEPDLSRLKNYSKYLEDDYPNAILELYGDALRDYADKYTGRKYYREIVRNLKKMRSISGGKKFVESLVDEFRETYPRRPAMMEELNKV